MSAGHTVAVKEPVQPLQIFNSVICGGAFVLLCDVRPHKAHQDGFIPSSIHLPPPSSSGADDELNKVDGVSPSQPASLGHGSEWPTSIADIEATSTDEVVRKRLGQRALRGVIVYEDGESTRLSAWAKHVLKLFKKDGKVLNVAVLQGGYLAYVDRYPFTIQTDPNSLTKSYPNEIISGRLYLGTLHHALDEQIIHDLQITHVVNAANSIGRETFARLGVTYMYVDVADDEDEDLYSFFKPVFQFIDDAIGKDTVTGPDGQVIKNQRRVLVHCQLGVSRSATLSIFYVMCKKRCSLVKAFDHVLKQRPQIYPNMGFRSQLRQAEIDLFNTPSISEESLEFLGEDGWEPRHDEIRRHPCCVM